MNSSMLKVFTVSNEYAEGEWWFQLQRCTVPCFTLLNSATTVLVTTLCARLFLILQTIVFLFLLSFDLR